MKKILSSLVRWAGIAAFAVVALPLTSMAATFDATLLEARRCKTYYTDDPINFVMTLDLGGDALNQLDPATIPDDFGVYFLLSDGSRRVAEFVSTIEEGGEYGLMFSYTVQANDYSIGLMSYENATFAGTLKNIKNKHGNPVAFFMSDVLPTPYGNMVPLEKQDDIEALKINPENATKFKINFLDEYGEKVPPTQVHNLKEGQTGIQYVINIGSKPDEDNPVEIIINWGAENVFCEGSATTNYMSAAEQIFTIDQILDNGAAPNGSHTYDITATTAGRADATMKAKVTNENPVIINFSADTLFGTNVVLSVGETVTVTAIVEDPAGELDDPMTATWKFGSQNPTSVENVWNGSQWMSVASGTIIRGGITSISFTVKDKNGGTVSTNDIVYAEQGTLLLANPADTVQAGMVNLGDGDITIVQPGSGSIAWDPNGNYLSGTKAVIRANPFDAATSADGYDSYWYKWYSGEDVGLEKSDPTRGLVDGYDPISKQATINLLADSSAAYADRSPIDRTVKYFFSKELYRPDNFGDIDGDRLGDEWEIKWFSQSALNFTDPVTGEPVLPAESGAPVRADGATLLYDFSNTGNMDGDGLPANCFANMDYTVEADILDSTGNVMIPAGTYNIQTFAYPLPANSISRFGYLPLGGTHMVDYEEEQDILAFRSNPYVDQNALNRILVDFSNELEFRGVGLYNQFVDEAGETIDFRPFGDGDEPNTNPMVSDTDSDGMPDGWEYYFWAVAYYNINPDQWLAFNGATPTGGTYKGTGDPISRDDILGTFNPTSAAFIDEDLDHDGLTNLEEFALGTNPIHWDTDGDGIPDGWEVMYGIEGGSGTTTTVDPETGATTTTVDNTQTIVLNPLKANDGNYNGDGDYFAIDGDLRHYDVFLSYDFDPRVGWCDPRRNSVSYAGNSFETEYPYTAAYTALEEFNLAAWYVEHGYVASVQGIDPNANDYWGKWTTDPCSPDTDGDGIPDGWEAYVGLNPNLAADAGQDLEKDLLHPQGDGLNNLQEFLCTMAAEIYPYIAEKYQAQIDEWPNKPWPTNPNLSIGFGYAHGGDTDNDQVLDGAEKGPNCNPTCVDTDHDYLPDLWECYFGTDPLVRDAFMDYDGDGLQNWQEYMTGSVWAWQYDKWYNAFRGTTGPGYGEVDMFDFFVDSYSIANKDPEKPIYQDATHHNYGGFGRAPHTWDCASGASARQAGMAGAGAPFFFLSAEVRMGSCDPKLINSTGLVGYGFDGYGAAEARNYGAVTFATTDPWATDSDHDGMDDFYEAYHGLNPLYGGEMLVPDFDLVALIDPVTMSPYPSEPWELTTYPWLAGDPDADPDKDGLSSREECANFYVTGGTHHTDPSPYWITDSSYERSFVNLYYQPGCTFAITLPPYWYFGIDGNVSNPNYAYSFEKNEGYDTDNDNVGDRSELTTDELSAKADPLDFDNPRRRKAMYFNGIDAACRTYGAYSTNDETEFRTFTVEAWICPVNPTAGHVQTIIERSAIVKQDTAKGDTSGKRLNFRLSITETGLLRGEFHNYQGAHVTMETDAANTGLRAGVWSHVALTYSGMPSKSGTLTIYVDGVAKKSAPSNLQAFNGYLQDYTVAYQSGDNETTEEYRYRATSCPIVLGASDDNPTGVINGYQSFVNGGIATPGIEPELVDFFEGWMDEVRIWDGARSSEGIRGTMFDRFDKADVAAYAVYADKINNNAVSLRHHYSFDSLPDTVPAADRSADAYLYPSDIETLPTGMAEVFTAPNDGSYPGIPWWNASAYVGYRYDTRHIQWIEDTVLRQKNFPIADAPAVQATRNDAGDIMGYSQNYYTVEFPDARSRAVSMYAGLIQPAAWLPNVANPYGCGYTTHTYGENLIWSVGTADTTTTTVDPTTGETNTTTTAGSTTAVVYNGYDTENEGALADGGSEFWSADLLPLGGVVADIDVALWDGKGFGYELATVDSDGDGIPDYWETLCGLDPFDASDAWSDFDGDGLDNLAEYMAGTDPNTEDSDGDGYPDYYDRDTDKSLTYGELYDDGDGMPSWWESQYGLNPRAYDADDDLDGDGWSNYSEYLAGTDPAMASRFPEPPLVANIAYDGVEDNGTLVVYAYTSSKMDGRPDAIYTQEVHSKDMGVLTVDKEYLVTIEENVTHYSGKLALGDIVNDDTFKIECYKSESMYDESLTFQGEQTTTPTSFYCKHCGTTYTYAQMVDLGNGTYRCPHGHGPSCDLIAHQGDNGCYIAYYGRTNKLICNGGTVGYIDYVTGEWYLDIPEGDYAGWTLVVSYTASQGSVFPFSMRRKWTSIVGTDALALAGGHLREGSNKFFAFLDLDGDFVFDEGEPAGMALYQPVKVGAGAVEVTIPLTDFLTGFPRLTWDPVEGVDGYSVVVTTASGASIVSDYTLDVNRPFLMEQDLLSAGGANLGSAANAIMDWKVQPVYGDYNPGASANTAAAIAKGSVTNSVTKPTRKTLSIVSPANGSIVSDASLVLNWKMDYRNEGAKITIKNTDTGKTLIDKVCYLPERVGALTGDYYYTIEPQKLLGSNAFVDLPDGNYSLTITENIRSTASGLTKQTATVSFAIDHSGDTNPNAKADGLGAISGTLTYYGKIPFTVKDEILGTFDGTATKMENLGLSRDPVPGSVTVKVVASGKTLFTASDMGAMEGYPRQGLYSTYEDMIQVGSYVVYGDAPAVSLELATPPAAGAQVVVSYKQYNCPIRVQAFTTTLSDGASFSVAPAAQTTVYNKGAFALEGLPQGTYYVRAFIDQNTNFVMDAWESSGYAMEIIRQTIGINNFASFDVPPGASNVEITITDKDTDSDLLPDAWEYYYYKKLTTQGGMTQKKVGVYLWQEYADGELDSNPLVEDTDGDGFPDVLEHLYGTNNHEWDSDGDGVGDLEEFLAGSDPADAASTARFKAPAPTFLEDGTPAVVLETPALSPGLYIQYTLLAKNNLGDPWVEVGSSGKVGVDKAEAVGLPRSTVTIPDPDGGEAAFYKVKVDFESDTLLP